jgi:hypothetical protein
MVTGFWSQVKGIEEFLCTYRLTKQSSIEIDFTYLKIASNCVRGHEELVRAMKNCENPSIHSIGLKACENEHLPGTL